jgi:response regulator RpfG family c-di-GMP phosphodiesterase
MSEKATQPKILFVDDEENILKAIKRLFMDEPFEILTASSGADGLLVLQMEGDVGVIVSDQRMPSMSGAEFLEKSKALAPDAIRMVLTGYADVSAAVDAINKGGAWKYLAKPWKDEELVLAVREAVERYALLEENRRLNALTLRQKAELEQWTAKLETMVQEQTIDIQKKSKDLEKLNEQLQKNFMRSIETFGGLIEMREKKVSSHSRNVAAYVRQIVGIMKLSGKDASDVIVAALLHDIGKIGVPDSVLQKDEAVMNEQEAQEYRKHAVRGQVAVDGIEGFHDIGRLIRHHHEQMDGAGFPDGLKRNMIPLGSRIIAVADAADRQVSESGSGRDSLKKALQHIEFHLDVRYDRQVYQALRLALAKQLDEQEKAGAARYDEVEVLPSLLTSGMVLTRDSRSGTGLLILAKGAHDRPEADRLDAAVLRARSAQYRGVCKKVA